MKKKYVRPSSLKSVEICSDFENDENAPVHPVTEQGSRIHLALETGETGNLNEDDMYLYEIMDAQRTSVLKRFESRVNVVEYFKEFQIKEGGQYRGTVDHLGLSTTLGLVMDYKAGFWKVDAADNNLQFQAYLSYLGPMFPHIEEWMVAIVQPRTGSINWGSYTKDDIENATTRVKMVQARAKTGQRKASNNCQYCALLESCETAYKKFANIKHQEEMLPTLTDTMGLIDPEDISRAMDVRDTAKKFMGRWEKAVATRAKDLLSQGYEITGWEMKRRKGRTVITDLEKVREETKPLGVSEREFAECIKPSLTEIIKRVRENAPSRQKGKTEEVFRSRIAGAVEPGETIEYVGRSK